MATVTMSSNGRMHGTKAYVVEQFTKHPGEVLHVNDLAVGSGAATEVQIRNCIGNMLLKDLLPGLEVVNPASAWRYMPNRNSGKRLFEEVGPTRDGSIIIQDERGNLLKAFPL